MPQLEVSTYATQIFWLITTFLAFWIVMDKFIVPKISEMVEARKRKYNDYIIKAEEINKKALASLKHYEEALAAAKKTAFEENRKNEEELKEFIKKEEEELSERLRLKIAENEERIFSEKEETLQKIKELSEIAAYEILQQLDIKNISMSDIQSLSLEEEN